MFPSQLQKEMIPHFIRGYFDGDGSIGRKDYPRVRFHSGCEEFLNTIQKKLCEFGSY